MRSLLRRLLCGNKLPEKTWLHSAIDTPTSRTSNKLLLGNLLTQMNRSRSRDVDLDEVEFKVFSQFGEDGIIQHLINHLRPANRTFIEIGTQDYTESNTRFLLMNNYWKGVAIDSSESNVTHIRNDEISVYYGLNSAAVFVTAENADHVVRQAAGGRRVGLLSIDIDGNDYWIWKAITSVEADIVIMEYNALLGADRPISIPYEPSFDRSQAHFSRLYYGCSLAALAHLASLKGYFLVGCNTAGNNAFFVHSDHRGRLPVRTVKDAYRAQVFCEPSVAGVVPAVDQKLSLIAGLTVVNVVTNAYETI